ncbi:hypothetical protein AN216_20130 [Streptomyces oceani]|uniref:Uncharacterized protein n=1 Tax=Streptomyces oceani TaxID=1075402 RepID=A0A1E7JYA1_9ACTN|nr:hypothetical protein AN216_20130 [Streptomyces oceani]
MKAADERGFLDSVRIHRWGGGIVYENFLDPAGGWRGAGRSRDALEAERAQPLNSRHVRWFQERYAHLERTLPPRLRAQLPEIARLGQRIGATVRVPSAGEP